MFVGCEVTIQLVFLVQQGVGQSRDSTMIGSIERGRCSSVGLRSNKGDIIGSKVQCEKMGYPFFAF